MNLLNASRARLTLSPLIEPDTSKITPTDTGESSSLKKVISCASLLSRIENAVLLKPDTYRPYVSVTLPVRVMRSVLVITDRSSTSMPSRCFWGGLGAATAAVVPADFSPDGCCCCCGSCARTAKPTTDAAANTVKDATTILVV